MIGEQDPVVLVDFKYDPFPYSAGHSDCLRGRHLAKWRYLANDPTLASGKSLHSKVTLAHTGHAIAIEMEC